jgi:insulysin
MDGDESDLSSSSNDSKTSISYSLRGALERFSQFFIGPTFRDEMIERELRAVDSEYANSLTSDAWRNFQFLKHVADPSHPLHKFGCGNYNTLTNGGVIHADATANITSETVEGLAQVPFHGGSSPRDSLVQFWNSHYHAQNMKVVVLGRGSLDDLQRQIEHTFAEVRPNATSRSPLTSSTADSQTVDHTNGAGEVNNSSEGEKHGNSNSLFTLENAKYGVAAFSREKGNLGVIREQIPVKERRSVKLSFAVPPKIEPALRQFMPLRLISHLLGHEAPHSLHAVLNDMGYINGLSSGTTMDTSDFGMFSLSLALTTKGYAHLEEVLELCWDWLHMVKQASVEVNDVTGKDWMEAYHEELAQMSKNAFQFRENGDPTGFVSSAADVLFLQEHQPQNILCGDAPEATYNREVTQAILDRLVPENCMVTVTNSDFSRGDDSSKSKTSVSSIFEGMDDQEWQVEPWYGAEYREMVISPEFTAKWSTPPASQNGGTSTDENVMDDLTLRLPGLNQFTPNDFSLRCDQEDGAATSSTCTTDNETTAGSKISTPPLTISDTPLVRLWHKMDAVYRVPKTFFQSFIMTPNVYRSPRTITACRLFEKVLKDDLNSFVYDAAVAGNSYRVAVSPSGFNLAVTGYSQKMPALLDALTNRIVTLMEEMKEGPSKHPGLAQKYEKAVQNLLRETKNFKLDGPMEIANYNSRLLIEDSVWHINSYVAEMEGELAMKSPLTMEECATLAEDCLTSRVKVHIH